MIKDILRKDLVREKRSYFIVVDKFVRNDSSIKSVKSKVTINNNEVAHFSK